MFTSTFLLLLVSKLLLDVWSHLAKLGSPVHMLQWAVRAVAHRHTHHITCLIWHVPSGAWRWACAHSSLNWIGCQWPCLKHLITVSDKTKEPRNCCLSLTLQLLVGALCSIDVEVFHFTSPSFTSPVFWAAAYRTLAGKGFELRCGMLDVLCYPSAPISALQAAFLPVQHNSAVSVQSEMLSWHTEGMD